LKINKPVFHKLRIKDLKTKIQKGFTMIELLIVIAVLGVLAIAVLATFNPIEQINRGRDTSSRSDAEQLLSAIDRYNANRGLWPWQDEDTDESAIVDFASAIDEDFPAGSTCSMMDNLGAERDPACPGTDEIKEAFIARLTSTSHNDLHIYYEGGSGKSVYICFNPQSKAFSQEADIRCDNAPSDFPPEACGSCPESLGDNENCACLP
jgi:prepilin-type N-terminal cleavage/methylation domain-containing protein